MTVCVTRDGCEIKTIENIRRMSIVSGEMKSKSNKANYKMLCYDMLCFSYFTIIHTHCRNKTCWKR